MTRTSFAFCNKPAEAKRKKGPFSELLLYLIWSTTVLFAIIFLRIPVLERGNQYFIR